jgi:hypothetical protein
MRPVQPVPWRNTIGSPVPGQRRRASCRHGSRRRGRRVGRATAHTRARAELRPGVEVDQEALILLTVVTGSSQGVLDGQTPQPTPSG